MAANYCSTIAADSTNILVAFQIRVNNTNFGDGCAIGTAKQTHIRGCAVIVIQTTYGVPLAVEGASVFPAAGAYGCPDGEVAAVVVERAVGCKHSAVDHNVRHQYGIGVGCATIDQIGKPCELLSVANLIESVNNLGIKDD